MKEILMSIRPQWCEKIFNGSKSIEVRKTCPKLEPPFEVLVYCTMPKERWSVGHQIFYNDTLYTLPTGELKIGDALELMADWMRKYNEDNFLNGKVIGSFVCDKIREIIPLGLRGFKLGAEWLKEMCLSKEQLDEYGGLKTLYSWHITEPKLFDKPRDITEFALYGRCAEDCDEYDICARDSEGGRMSCKYFKRTFLERPPQSYCFVETDEN